MRALRAALASLALTACVSDPSPSIAACRPPGTPSDELPSSGSLSILPSELDGVRVDGAWWTTSAHTVDMGASEELVYRARVRSDRDVLREELALLYEAPSAPPVVDAVLLDPRSFNDLHEDSTFLRAGETTTVTRNVSLGGGLKTGARSAMSYCPTSVRLVSRRKLALFLNPALTGAVPQAVGTAPKRTPLDAGVELAMDSVVDEGLDGSLLVGAVRNVSNTTLHDLVVARIVERKRDSIIVAHGGAPFEVDTIEAFAGDVPAHHVAGFVSVPLNFDERLVKWTVYSASSIRGRPVAGHQDRYHVGWFAHRTGLRYVTPGSSASAAPRTAGARAAAPAGTTP